MALNSARRHANQSTVPALPVARKDPRVAFKEEDVDDDDDEWLPDPEGEPPSTVKKPARKRKSKERRSADPEEIIADTEIVSRLFSEQSLTQAIVKQLKNFFRNHKTKVSGRKAELVARVAALLAPTSEVTSTTPINTNQDITPDHADIAHDDGLGVMPPTPPIPPSFHVSPPARNRLTEAVLRA